MRDGDRAGVVRSLQGGSGGRLVHLVDVPGHPRVRRAFERYAHAGGVRGVVFVVDALDFVRHTTEAAECAPAEAAVPGRSTTCSVLLPPVCG